MPTTWPSFLGLHEFILYIVILLLVVAFGGGPALKALFNTIIRIFGHGSETVIIEPGGDMARKPDKELPCTVCGKFDAKDCPFHEAEHERSMRNEETNKEQWKAIEKLGDEMRAGFKDVQSCVSKSQEVIIAALSSRPRGK